MSQWVDDVGIDIQQSFNQQGGSFIQDSRKPDILHKIQVVGNMDISPQKRNLTTHHRIIQNDCH